MSNENPNLKSALENFSGDTYAVLSLRELRNLVADAEASSVRLRGSVQDCATVVVYFKPAVDPSGDLQMSDPCFHRQGRLVSAFSPNSTQ